MQPDGQDRRSRGPNAPTAVIVEDDASRDTLTTVFGHKYGLEYRIFQFIERLARSGQQDRVMLRISAV